MAATMELGSDTDPRNATFSIADEDHTLGNSLRFVLNKDPRVAFCGYSVPHPSENRINIRVQTTGVPAREVLKDALNDLMAMNQHVVTTFDTAVERFKANQGMNELSMKSGMTSQHSGSVKKP